MSAPIPILGRRQDVIDSVAPQIRHIIEEETRYCQGREFPPSEMVEVKGTKVRRGGILVQAAGYTQERIQATVSQRLQPLKRMQYTSLVVTTVKQLSPHEKELLCACEGIQDLSKSILIQVLAYHAATS